MFKSYDAAEVPDIMPFPELGGVATTKGEETAVPKLNEHQQSWILDIGVRGIDLPSLKGKAAKTFYEKPTDRVEEARLPALVTAWKAKKPAKKKNNSAADDDDASDEEEDEGGRGGLLRGYTKAGWRQAIQKVISNKRTAENNKRKTKNDGTSPIAETIAETAALSKLLGLVASSGRDQFRQDRYDDILEYSKTLTDAINAGSKFRKAEGLMWAEEDQASWEAAAASERGRQLGERQRLVASGFKNMVDSLHCTSSGGAGRSGSKDIHVRQTFEKQTPQLVKDSLNAMYAWAEKPLKDYAAPLKIQPNAAPQSPSGMSWLPPWRRSLARGLRVSSQGAGGQDDEEEDRADEDARRADEAKGRRRVLRTSEGGGSASCGRGARVADEAKAEAARLADEEGGAARLADEAKAERASCGRGQGGGGASCGGREHRTSASASFAPSEEGHGWQEAEGREAALERQKKLAAEVTVNGAKPSFEYVWVPRSPGQTQAKLYEQNLSCAATEDPWNLSCTGTQVHRAMKRTQVVAELNSIYLKSRYISSSRHGTQVSVFLKYSIV
ncbi:hypothetical protein B0H13DRAFT_1915657 [Mycena leptocephala]|nr:hypothetical protein B0H13DRAFT_1915657 [Mycena leptocephala]